MLLTGELRWFWHSPPPVPLYRWFTDPQLQGIPPGGGPPGRTDVYIMIDESSELGIKFRGGGGEDASAHSDDAEIKGLMHVDNRALTTGPLAGPVEVWCKWTVPSIEVEEVHRVVVKKVRWLRQFDTTGAYPREVNLGGKERSTGSEEGPPAIGCNVELTEVTLSNGDRWSTFALEAFGDRENIPGSIEAVAALLVHRGINGLVKDGEMMSYPGWLSRQVKVFTDRTW